MHRPMYASSPWCTFSIQEAELLVSGQRCHAVLATNVERETRVWVLHGIIGQVPLFALGIGVDVLKLLFDHLPAEEFHQIGGGGEDAVFLTACQIRWAQSFLQLCENVLPASCREALDDLVRHEALAIAEHGGDGTTIGNTDDEVGVVGHDHIPARRPG